VSVRFVILGAGAVGGYFGARLAEAGADVTFLVRPARADAIRSAGLRIASPDGDATLQPALLVAGEGDSGPAPFDCALLACKAYDLDTAIAALEPFLSERSAVLPLLNGLRHLDTLDQAFGADRVLGGLCQISATLDADGGIRHLGIPPRIVFGERPGGLSPRIDALITAMAGARFEARASDDVLQDMWEKFALLASLAATTCLMRAPVGVVVTQAGGVNFTRRVAEECKAVAAAAGHPLRPKFAERLMSMMTDRESTLAASMLRDLERGGPTEGNHVLGDLAARAAALGVTAPTLDIAALHLASYEARRLAGNQ